MIEFFGKLGEYLGFPIAASEHALGIDHVNGWVHWFMLILFIGWGIFFIVTLVKFGIMKGDRKADYEGVKNHYSTYAEYAVIVFEVFLLIAFAIPVWASVKTELPDIDDNTVEIRVIAQQFAWNIHYPGADGKFGNTSIYLVDEEENAIGLDRDSKYGADDIVKTNQLNIPVDRDIMIYLSSKDVIHSFSLPEMRVKQDAIPGITIPVFFKATLKSDDFLERIKYGNNTKGNPSYTRSIAGGSYSNYTCNNQCNPLDEDYCIENLSQRYQPDTFYGLDSSSWIDIMNDVSKNQYRGYQIACAQLCGNSHYKMRGFMTVQTQEEYESWLDENAPEEDDDDDW